MHMPTPAAPPSEPSRCSFPCPPLCCSCCGSLRTVCYYDSRGAEIPRSISTEVGESSWSEAPRQFRGGSSVLLGRSFDVDMTLAIPPDGRAKSVVQHRQQRFHPFRAGLKRTSDGQPA